MLKPSAEDGSGAERPPSASGESEHSAGSAALAKLHRCPAASCTQEFRQRGQLIRHAANTHGLLLPGTGSTRPVTRTRPSFFLAPTPMTRLSRRLCRHLIKPRRAARTPIHAINVAAIRAECEYTPTGRPPNYCRAQACRGDACQVWGSFGGVIWIWTSSSLVRYFMSSSSLFRYLHLCIGHSADVVCPDQN